MSRGRTWLARALALTLAVTVLPSLADASDHLDAPSLNPGNLEADINDLYVFQGANPSATTLAMTVSPAAGAVGPDTFGTDILYQFNIVDTPTTSLFDVTADIAYRAKFGAPDSSGNQPFTLYRADGSAADGHSVDPANVVTSGTTNTNTTFDTAAGADTGKFFAGLRSDPFFFDLGGFQGSFGEVSNGRMFNDGMEADFFEELNVLAIVLEIPDSVLPVQQVAPTFEGFATWASTATMHGGSYEQLDRSGRPVINTIVNSTGNLVNAPSGNKDDYNEAHPRDDAQFQQAVKDALAALSALDSEGPFDSFWQSLYTSVFLPDKLPYNKHDTSSSAVPGIFNGRRLEDDVIDIELNIMTGGNPLGFTAIQPRDSNGGIWTDGIGPHDDYLSVFPYLGEPHKMASVPATVGVIDQDRGLWYLVDPILADLNGDNEVPSSSGDPNGKGTAQVTFNQLDDRLCFDLELENLQGTVTAAHIHKGGAGVNGPVVVDFDFPTNGTSGCLDTDGALIDQILADLDAFYVNIHSDAFPAGAVRGQLGGGPLPPFFFDDPERQNALDTMPGERFADTRPGAQTVDGDFAGAGKRPAGSVYEVPIAGRGGVPKDASGAVINAAAVGPDGPGFLTVDDCKSVRPNASALNYVGGTDVANEIVAGLSNDGSICVFTFAATDILIDVVGYFMPDDKVKPTGPARLADSRPGTTTIDGQLAGFGRTTPGSTTTVPVEGRAGVPKDIDAAIVNVAAVDPTTNSFVSVNACLPGPPVASSLNHTPGVNRANELITPVDTNGNICIFTDQSIDLIVDVVGYVEKDSELRGIDNARYLETRPGSMTFDGESQGGGPVAPGSTTKVRIAGRGEVPGGSKGAIVNVTAVDPRFPGFLSVDPCLGGGTPNASSLNYTAGVNGANELIAELDENGDLCIFSSAQTDLLLDVVGFFEPDADPFLGDWDGDGIDTPGLYRPSDGKVFLRNSNTPGIADIEFFFGDPGDVPIIGDWDGDGDDTVSLYRPSESKVFITDKLGSNNNRIDPDFEFIFGDPGDEPFGADFDNDGKSTVGVRRGDTFWWRNSLDAGPFDNSGLKFGDLDDEPMFGDWDGDGLETPGVFRPSTSTIFLRNLREPGIADMEIFTDGFESGDTSAWSTGR